MTSNSVIISKLLTEEGNEFSSDIENFLNIKFNELKGKLNNHIQEKVNENINKFYNTPNDNLETELFDKHIVELNLRFDRRGCKIYSCQTRIETDILNIKIINENYFEIFKYYEVPPNNGGITYSWLFFKNFMLKKGINSSTNSSTDYYRYVKHNIPNHILYIIKHLNYDIYNYSFGIKLDKYFIELANISFNNNKIFYPNCLEFEKICEDEYNKINNIKEELKNKGIELYNLIEEQKKNINYYKELDDKNKSYEEDKKSFYEMKNNLLIAKDKIKLMKDELLKEKELFETEKEEFNEIRRKFSINSFDVDEFLNEK
jgi:hypothetical protein